MLTPERARRWYPDDPVHGFEHVLRVVRLAERLAQAEGADLEIVRVAALLHDAQDTEGEPERTGERRGARRSDHHERSAELAGAVLRADGWPRERIKAVQHCIRAHRFRDDTTIPQTLEARVLFDADKLDAIGATGAARAIGYALAAGQPFYARPSARFLETGALEQGEQHSAYHEYLFKLVKIKDRLFTNSGRLMAESRQRLMIEFFERLAEEMEI